VPDVPDYETVLYEEEKGVAWVTLNRPQAHNAFNTKMRDELYDIWQTSRRNDDVRCLVVTGAGDRAFCTGIDRQEAIGEGYLQRDEAEADNSTWDFADMAGQVAPKTSGLWKPVIAAVNGMACGGAFYILGEVEFIIAAEHATFFDPHVTYGMTASYEPILLSGRMAFGELVRMTLLGAHERISAATARLAGLVTEVVPAAELLEAAQQLATTIASQPPAAVQASLRTLWAARSLSADQATQLGNVFLQLGTSAAALKKGQESFTTQERPKWRLR
jgi:enoyl-CoA hydratase/carnithine racemase